MLSKSLTKFFDLGVWELDLAAWIFTGYSPLKLKKTGHIIRLVDDLEIPHGTTEFRDAQKEQKEILSLLNQNVGEAQGFIFTPSDDGENADIWTPNHHFELKGVGLVTVLRTPHPSARGGQWQLFMRTAIQPLSELIKSVRLST